MYHKKSFVLWVLVCDEFSPLLYARQKRVLHQLDVTFEKGVLRFCTARLAPALSDTYNPAVFPTDARSITHRMGRQTSCIIFSCGPLNASNLGWYLNADCGFS